MKNPMIVSCPAGVWTKVATNIRGGRIHQKITGIPYWWTYRVTGQAAPTTKDEGLVLFDKDDNEPLINTSGADIYVYCDKAGRVRVDDYEPTVDNFLQDQSTERLSLFLGQELDTATLLAGMTKDDESVDIETTGHIPAVGQLLCLQESNTVSQAEIASVTPIAGNQYTIGITVPIDYPYTVAAVCAVINIDMDIDASVTPVTFKIGPIPGTKWDITRFMVAMVLSSAGDDGLFGNIAALAASMYVRKNNGATSQNLFAVKDNSDFRVEGYDVAYPTRSGGGGSHGMAARITFSGQDKSGVVERLDGDNSETFSATIRSDLTLINKFRIKVQGHVVE